MDENNGMDELVRVAENIPQRPTSTDLGAIEHLRDLLKSKRLAEVQSWPQQSRNKSLVALFECALSADVSAIKSNEGRVRESLTVLGETIEVLLDALTHHEAIESVGAYLVGFINHPFPPLRIVALNRVKKAVTESNVVLPPLILKSCASCLADEELSIAAVAIDILSAPARSQEGLRELLDDPDLVANQLLKIMNQNDTVKFRVFEWAVKVSQHSPVALDRCAQLGFLDKLLDEFRRDDVLSQLNSLQLLTDLAITQQGFEYLQEQNIFQVLDASVKGHDSPMAVFIIPGLMKFFGNVAARKPDVVLHRYTGFVESLFSCLTNGDFALQSVALETVAHIGSSRDGKLALQKNGLDRYIGSIFRVAEAGSAESRVIALQCIAQLISVKGMGVPDGDEALEVTNSWFRLLQQSPMSKVVSLCQQPFPDIRNAALRILEGVASQRWGLMSINSSPGLMEFLIDRGPIKDKAGKEAKFDIVETIVNHPDSNDIFGQVKMAALRRFYREGPFFVAVQAEVALEGE